MNNGSELEIKINASFSGKMSMSIVKTKEILGTHWRAVFLLGDYIRCNKMKGESEKEQSLQSNARIKTRADLSLFI